MNESTRRREIEVLIQGYLEESLTEDESRRLLASLRGDSSLVTTILENLRTDCLIRAVVSEITAIEEVDQEEKILPIQHPAEISTVPARPSKRKRHWPQVLALAACLALLVGLSVWFFGPTMGEPALAAVQGVDVSIERGTEFVPAANGMRLQPTDVLRVGTNDTATIGFGRENTRIEVRAGTGLKLASLKRGKRFNLLSGTIQASVSRQRPFQPMIVTTPNAEATVMGTEFSLTAATNRTRLDVTEGHIRLTSARDHSAVKVNAGQYAIVEDQTFLAALTQTGSILREYWTNIPGDYFTTRLTAHPDYPDRPSGRQWLDKFEAPSNWGTDYGARFRGFVHPPMTGDYTFHIAASDGGELLLSRDEYPQNRLAIASAEYSQPREWTKMAKQQSSAITLVAGRRYYIEVLKKQGKGPDHLAVAWKRPDDKFEIIPGECLSPYKPKPKESKP